MKSAFPWVLFKWNGAGTAADLESGLRRISVTVVDEYGQHEPLVTPIDLSGDESGEFELVVKLVADRQGSDMDG